MNFFSVANYLKYILLSGHSRGHGIHSPFVFDFVTRIMRNKVDPEIVCCIEKVRKKMESDTRTIVVKDLGSGQEKNNANHRKVSEIAKRSSVPAKYGVLLSNMAAEFGKPLIVELGTSLGISTMYMASAARNIKVDTIEGCPAISELASENFKKAGLVNVIVNTGSFDEVLPEITSISTPPGLVYIDGNHRKEPVLKYFNHFVNISDSKTVIVIDDIYYSKEMEDAWSIIKKSERVSATIDIFRMGVVFFREGIVHKDYIIRY